MKKNRYGIIFFWSRIILTVLFYAGAISGAAARNNDFLTALTEEVLEANPQVKSFYLQFESGRAAITAAGSLPQPQIGFAYFGEAVQTKVGPQERKYSFSQAIPFPTKLALKGKIAAKAADEEYAKYVLTVRDAIQQAKMALFDYYFSGTTLASFREEKTILEQMASVVRRRYESSPEGSQADIVKINLEITSLEAQIISIQAQENTARAALNRLLARPSGAALNIPPEWKPFKTALASSEAQIREEALRESPLVLLDRLGVEKQNFKLSLAKNEYIPDFGVMSEYIQIGNGTTMLANDGKDAWVIGVNVRVPLWFWRIQSEIKAQQYKLDAVKSALKDKENFVSYKINDIYFKLKSLWQLIDLYENILYPQARQNFSVSRRAYEQGSGDFLNWLDAERKLISIRLATTGKIVEYNKTLAQLEYILGHPVD